MKLEHQDTAAKTDKIIVSLQQHNNYMKGDNPLCQMTYKKYMGSGIN
jgi:hypothetical protein